MSLFSEKLTQVFDKVLVELKYDKPGKKNPSDKMGNQNHLFIFVS